MGTNKYNTLGNVVSTSQKTNKTRHLKVKTDHIKYVVIDKKTKKATLHRYKTKISAKIGVSVRTLDRNIPYENENYLVFTVESTEI